MNYAKWHENWVWNKKPFEVLQLTQGVKLLSILPGATRPRIGIACKHEISS